MTTGIEKKLFTAEQLAELPTGTGKRYELMSGELIEMSPSGGEHGEFVFDIGYFLKDYLLKNKVGRLTGAESGFYITRNPDTVRAPDLAFIPHERLPEGKLPKGYMDIVPALVIEVISPHDKAVDIEEKTRLWLQFGVTQVWNVYPDGQRVLVHTQDGLVKLYQGEESVPGGELLPDFTLKLSDIFKS